ncbi:hypothetical protein Tco_0769953 [Tanacetum coccineum]|uniref:Transposase (putative) gypsy type domain-containing protein n=1 Tax=Tanacetum coccineum TaxID=301880 RepID=A0ABQ4ZBU7_9ASTR
MDKLPSWYIVIYIEQLEQGGLRIPFLTFFLVVIKHFGVHVSQLVPMGVNQVILFEIRCRSLDIPPTVSLFRVFYKLCKQGHWFSFENKTGGHSRKCFKEVTSSLKGWKKKFFLIDRRAISDAMPWRHSDTDAQDDFPNNYNEEHAKRLVNLVVLLRLPPRHFLYLCGLTTACRHPELRYVIKDAEGQGNAHWVLLFAVASFIFFSYPYLFCWLFLAVITMDDFLLLHDWTGTIVSKTQEAVPENQRPRLHVTHPLAEGATTPDKSPSQKVVEKPNSKITAAREKKDKLNATKTIAKRVGEGNSTAPHKKRVQKNQKVANSGFEGTISITPLHQASPKPVEEGVTSAPKATAGTVAGGTHPVDPEREVVELSKNTRPPTPSVMSVTQPSPDGVAFFDVVSDLADAKMDRHKLIRDFIPDVVKKLLSSSEYQKSIVIPVGLCYTVGWLGGLSLGKTEDQIAQVLSETRNLDIEGSKT